MEKEYTRQQLWAAEQRISFALTNAKLALEELDEPIPDDSLGNYNIDNEVSCCYWYIFQTREQIHEQLRKIETTL